MSTLATAHGHIESMIDQLLQDFLHVWPDDCSAQFVDECLPLLFNIFRYSKVIINEMLYYNPLYLISYVRITIFGGSILNKRF